MCNPPVFEDVILSHMHESLLRRLTAAHTDAHMVGWDFSRLAGRMEADHPGWDLDNMCVEAMSVADAVLDVGTGGGERLLGLLDRLDEQPGKLAVTEGWAPNIDVARKALEPLGISVVAYDSEDGDGSGPGLRGRARNGRSAMTDHDENDL